MLGKACEIGIEVIWDLEHFNDWKTTQGQNKSIIDIKFSYGPQTFNFQQGYAILVIYKEADSHE